MIELVSVAEKQHYAVFFPHLMLAEGIWHQVKNRYKKCYILNFQTKIQLFIVEFAFPSVFITPIIFSIP